MVHRAASNLFRVRVALSMALAFFLLATILLWAPAARAVTVAADGKPAVVIVLADDPIPAEETAARELADYLGKVTGGTFPVVSESKQEGPKPAVYVGPTSFAKGQGLDPADWGAERWAMRTVGDSLILVGGRPRGSLYAVYHFLEDIAGVRWWNPFEEHVPKRPTLEIGPVDRSGQPTFRYRDIHRLYANDGGRFAARNRINGKGFGAIDAAYGCGVYYGPPGGVHTFYRYVPPKEYFDEHPEWFSRIGDKRSTDRAQLCLTNGELRGVVIAKLKAYVQRAREEAERAGRPAPLDFDISQNDWGGMCECPDCQAIAKQEGSESGPLLDFLNHVADAIRDDYPEVRINTLAYQMTEDPPRSIRPRGNVIPRLCDTNANLLRPITHLDNQPFAERVAAWGRITRQLRIWDYAITYKSYPGLPLPTAHTYGIDYRYFAEHNVEGIFTEHEEPILADMRDFKVWVMMKLLEDPYRDYDALVRDFTEGFYGPAAGAVRRYLDDLEAAAEADQSSVNWFPALSQYGYLTLDLLQRAHKTFDEAEKAVASDPVRVRRVRHARLPLDRATMVLWPKLMREWIAKDGSPEEIPLDREAVARRCRDTWHAQIDLRIPESQQAAERAKVKAELVPLAARPAYVPPPEKFRHLSLKDVFDFTAEQSNNWKDVAKRAADSEAECGITNRLELSDKDMEKYKLPMPWGLYDPARKKGLGSARIMPEDVPGSGYHWYKLGTFQVTPSTYVYFFWSWIIQFRVDAVVDPDRPDQELDVWARVKFEGPGFPHGRPDDANAICVERVVLVRSAGTE